MKIVAAIASATLLVGTYVTPIGSHSLQSDFTNVFEFVKDALVKDALIKDALVKDALDVAF